MRVRLSTPLGTPPLGTPPRGTPPLGTPPLGTPLLRKSPLCSRASTLESVRRVDEDQLNDGRELLGELTQPAAETLGVLRGGGGAGGGEFVGRGRGVGMGDRGGGR